MPAFIESPIFPLRVQFGSSMGPTFDTDVVVVDSGKEYRNENWQYPLQKGKVVMNAGRASNIAVLREWIYVARAKSRGFRVKDLADYKVPDISGIGVLVQVSGSTYQMVKRYTRGDETGDRLISKPTVGATSVYDVTSSGETLKLLHTHYELDESTGLVTISFTPDGELQWRGTFEVPMRFDMDAQEFEMINREGDSYIQGMGDIPLIELRV